MLKSFDEQSKALLKHKDSENPEIPKLSKGLSVIKWAEAIHIYLCTVIGVGEVPLIYVVTKNSIVPDVPIVVR